MKKMISMLLVVAVLVGIFPIGAQAQEFFQTEKSQQLGMSQIGSDGYVTMTTSQKMLDLLKVTEGYSQKAYSDNTQYSIGYGTKANSSTEKLPDGQKGYEEAEKRLKADVAERERLLNNYFRNNLKLQPNQHQFDALVSFTYNNGSGWFFGSRLADWLRNPTTEIDFMNAFGQWSHVGTTPWYGLTQRRIREALVFLRGEYYLPSKPTQEHLIKTEEFLSDPGRFIRVNGNLPYFASVIMAAGEGAKISDRVEYRQIGGTLGSLPTPSAEGKEFLGWQITMEDNSAVSPRPASSSTVVEQNLYLEAKWDVQTPVKPETPKPPVESLPFTDVSTGAWYYDNVSFVYANGYMSGTAADRFSPEQTVTRAMFVTMLYRVAGSPEVTQEQKEHFADTQDQYFTDAAGWAWANGIVSGVGEGRFAPNDRIIRQDAELMFYKLCVEYFGISAGEPADLSVFADLDQLSSYAKDAVAWAVAVEMMAGEQKADGLYMNPRNNLTRAQAATLITRFVKDIIG